MNPPGSEPKRRPSPLSGALVALVLERPGYAYQLVQRVNERLGPTWEFHPKSVYVLLDRLERDGVLRSERRDRPGGETPRQSRELVTYYPTERAEEWRRAWMARPVRRESTRSELLARMAVARSGDEPLILAALEEYRDDTLRLVEECAKLRRPRASGLARLLLAAVDDEIATLLQADLEWIDGTRRRLAKYVEAQGG